MFSQTNPGARVKANRVPTGDPTADGYWAGDYSKQKGPPRRRLRCSELNALRFILRSPARSFGTLMSVAGAENVVGLNRPKFCHSRHERKFRFLNCDGVRTCVEAPI